MKLQKMILMPILRLEAFFVSFLKIKQNRITFISLEGDQLTADLKLIYDQLDPQNYDLKRCLIHYHKDLWGQFLYFLNCLKQLYLINTSKVVLIHDNNFVISHFKREGVVVLQVWHACGAVKKFGNVVTREYPIANYDYVLSTSTYWQQPYSEAFSVHADQVLPIGMPRTDELFDPQVMAEHRARLLTKYPILKHKKVVLYAPTFRGNIYQGFSCVPFDARQILSLLGEDYVLLYKFHPLLGDYQLDQGEKIINMNHEDTHALFSVCDYLISDYSSIVFDYMILEKPLIFYTPDLTSYTKDLGVFVDIHEFGFPVCANSIEVAHAILNYDVGGEKFKESKEKFFTYQDGQSTKRVVQFLQSLIQSAA